MKAMNHCRSSGTHVYASVSCELGKRHTSKSPTPTRGFLSDQGFAMQLTDIRIKLCDDQSSRLKAFCALTFDNTFVIRDVKLIDGNDGLFLAMPSRKLSDHCGRCGDKNHLRARFCNNCGSRLDEHRYLRYQNGNGHGSRLKLHADIAHPINADCRHRIEEQ